MGGLITILGIALTHHFYKSGAIWNIHAKVQPHRFGNGDISLFDQIPIDRRALIYHFLKSGAI